MLTIDATASSSNDKPVDKYLPEPQSFKAVLKLDNDVRNAWLHAIKMEIMSFIDNNTSILGKKSRKDERISPHFEKWRLYWSLSPSLSNWPSLCQTSTGIGILLS
jgi:hypothetical protein